MDKNYQTPSITDVEILAEGMVLTSSFDLTNNTETLQWGDYEEL